MEKAKAEKIIKISNWVRFLIFVLFLTLVVIGFLTVYPTSVN
jgi:hypothetical protein